MSRTVRINIDRRIKTNESDKKARYKEKQLFVAISLGKLRRASRERKTWDLLR